MKNALRHLFKILLLQDGFADCPLHLRRKMVDCQLQVPWIIKGLSNELRQRLRTHAPFLQTEGLLNEGVCACLCFRGWERRMETEWKPRGALQEEWVREGGSKHHSFWFCTRFCRV